MDPRPDEATLRRIYAWDSYHLHHYRNQTDAGHRQPATLGVLRERIPPPARILDFGCGTGEFMLAAARLGYECRGVELDPSAIQAAAERTGLPVTDLDDALRAGLRVEVIHLCDVLAHLPDPRATLRSLEPLLADGGAFLIAGPLERGRTLVHWVGAAGGRLRRRLGWSIVGSGPPTMLVRTGPREQRRFFARLGYEELLFETTETGWPYRLPGGPPDRSPGTLARHALGSAAVALDRLVPVGDLGNRYTAIVRPR